MNPQTEITRLIVEDAASVCLVNSALRETTLADLRKLLPSQFGPFRVISTPKVDSAGCALMRVYA